MVSLSVELKVLSMVVMTVAAKEESWVYSTVCRWDDLLVGALGEMSVAWMVETTAGWKGY